MKRHLTILLLLFIAGYQLRGQQLPLFQQKLTDDFLFNPAYTGLSGGSVSFNYRKLWSGITDSPDIFYATGHTMLPDRQLGFGGSFYTERQDLIANSRGMFSSSYVFRLTNYTLTFGLGVEYFQSDIDRDKVFARDLDDPLLNAPNRTQWDVSSGFVLSHQLFDVGVGYGRMGESWSNDAEAVLSHFVAISGNGYLPVRYGYDIVEPRVIYQINPVLGNVLSTSVFYTYDNQYLVGLTYRSGSVGAASIGLRWDNRYLLAYSVEQRFDREGADLGFSHELTLRFDLNKQVFRRINPDNTENINSSTLRKKSN